MEQSSQRTADTTVPAVPRLWYFPIEPYEERYSVYLSSQDGFWETFLSNNHIQHVTLRPVLEGFGDVRIRSGKGCVLDTSRRSAWAMRQVEMFLTALDAGEVCDGDVVYIEDFWHPGIEALPYARSLYKVNFKIYSWCHAQSWDESDFLALAGTASWIRPFELGIAGIMDGIFVADAGLKEMMIAAGVKVPIHPVGTAWNTEWIRHRYTYCHVGDSQRQRLVVFASRWDPEKNPRFFCALASKVLAERQDICFAVTTGFSRLRSNDPSLVDEAYRMCDVYPDNFKVLADVRKKDYFRLLNNARVHFNCSWHDWVSYGLCESVAFGCLPLFPNHKSFPLALQFDRNYLYKYLDLEDAKRKLYALLDVPVPCPVHILRRFDNTIPYVAALMGVYDA